MTKINPFQMISAGNLNNHLHWHCEPTAWGIKENKLHVVCDGNTDFWQKTHYGFRADNGHFLYVELEGDFTLETHVDCEFQHQYDQAGLMVWASEDFWVKSSVENEIGEPRKLGAVVTNHGYSDWSTQDVNDSVTYYRLQLIRHGSDYKLSYFLESTSTWVQIRLFHLFDKPMVRAGIYACSPKEGGFRATFSYLKVE